MVDDRLWVVFTDDATAAPLHLARVRNTRWLQEPLDTSPRNIIIRPSPKQMQKNTCRAEAECPSEGTTAKDAEIKMIPCWHAFPHNEHLVHLHPQLLRSDSFQSADTQVHP